MFFPREFYCDLGLALARVAVELESFFDRQQSIFQDMTCRQAGPVQSQYHVELTSPSGGSVRILTFPARTSKEVNPDFQFGALQRTFPVFDVGAYRSGVLQRLDGLVDTRTKTQHRFIKFSYDRMLPIEGRTRAIATFEWAASQVRCAAAVEAARASFVPAALVNAHSE